MHLVSPHATHVVPILIMPSDPTSLALSIKKIVPELRDFMKLMYVYIYHVMHT